MFLRHLKAHFQVVFAMMTRAMLTQHKNALGGYLWAVLEPAGMIALLVMAYSAFSRTPPLGDSVALFYCAGYLPFVFYRSTTNRIATSVAGNINLLHFPRVNAYDTVIGEFLVLFMTNAVVFIIIITGAYIIVGETPHVDIPNIVLPVSLGMMLGLGIGMINAVLFVLVPTWSRVWSVLNRPLLLISGIFHLPSALPPGIRSVFMLNPLADMIDWTRVGFYPGYTAPYTYRFYVVEWAFITFFVGLLMLRVFRRKVVDA